MGHSSAVKLQMKRMGGLAGMAASPICVNRVSGGCLVSLISKEHKLSVDTSA